VEWGDGEPVEEPEKAAGVKARFLDELADTGSERLNAELQDRLAGQFHLGAQAEEAGRLEAGDAPEVERLAESDGVGVAAAAA